MQMTERVHRRDRTDHAEADPEAPVLPERGGSMGAPHLESQKEKRIADGKFFEPRPGDEEIFQTVPHMLLPAHFPARTGISGADDKISGHGDDGQGEPD